MAGELIVGILYNLFLPLLLLTGESAYLIHMGVMGLYGGGGGGGDLKRDGISRVH